MISEELLSEVVGYKVCNIFYNSEQRMNDYEEKLISFKKESNYCWRNQYNVYEIAHRCKEWALLNGYIIYSSLNYGSRLHGFSCVKHKHGGEDLYYFSEETEFEAIFKCCQWILDNK